MLKWNQNSGGNTKNAVDIYGIENAVDIYGIEMP